MGEVRVGSWSPAAVAAVLACVALVFVTPEVAATRWTVGGNMGWTSNVNYTMWAQDKHFYNGDWLFFVYDRNQMSVLEVNKTVYENCNSDQFLHNWTTGAGRDVVPLNVTRNYYFISGNGFCNKGMKVAIHVEKQNLPPPPEANSPVNTPVENLAPSPVGAPQVNAHAENLAPSPNGDPKVNGHAEDLAPPPKVNDHVENLAPSPKGSQVNEESSAPASIGGQFVLAVVFAIGTILITTLMDEFKWSGI